VKSFLNTRNLLEKFKRSKTILAFRLLTSHLLEIHFFFKNNKKYAKVASKAKVESADYFLAMLDASTAGGENIETAISNFTKFFQARKLSALRRHMTV